MMAKVERWRLNESGALSCSKSHNHHTQRHVLSGLALTTEAGLLAGDVPGPVPPQPPTLSHRQKPGEVWHRTTSQARLGD